jgi:hypothetical protein
MATAEAQGDWTIYEDALDSVDMDIIKNVDARLSDIVVPLDRIHMLGPELISRQATTMQAKLEESSKHAHKLADGLIPGRTSTERFDDGEDGWDNITDAQDRVQAERAIFVERARAILINPTGDA